MRHGEDISTVETLPGVRRKSMKKKILIGTAILSSPDVAADGDP